MSAWTDEVETLARSVTCAGAGGARETRNAGTASARRFRELRRDARHARATQPLQRRRRHDPERAAEPLLPELGVLHVVHRALHEAPRALPVAVVPALVSPHHVLPELL